MGCSQAVVGKKKFLLQFEDGHKKQISSSSLVFLSSKEEVYMDEAISHSLWLGILRLENLACL